MYKRQVEGKMKAIRFARENNIPFLGICLGLQASVIEFARNVCKIPEADSREWSEHCEAPVVTYVDGQQNLVEKSGTMRLGSYECELKKDSISHSLYKKKTITERHRHRLEVNSEYIKNFQEQGFIVTGINPETNLVEIMELDKSLHNFFVGVQAHPEFKSRLLEPAPLFDGLVKAAIQFNENLNTKAEEMQD